MRKSIVFALLLMLGGIALQAKQIVVIGEFKNKTEANSDFFRTLIDRITNGIVNTRKFTLVDNARLKEAIDEQKKVDMGLSPETGAPKAGKIKSAGYVIYGTVLAIGCKISAIDMHGVRGTRVTATVELNLRIMDAETGEAIASKIVKATRSTSELKSRAEISDSNYEKTTIQDAIQKASEKVVESLMELAFPTEIIKVGSKSVYVNLTEERARHGALLNVFTLGESLSDPDTGESLGNSEELIGKLKITRTAPKFAIAEPIAPLTVAQLKKGMRIRPISEDELKEAEENQRKSEATSFRKRF